MNSCKYKTKTNKMKRIISQQIINIKEILKNGRRIEKGIKNLKRISKSRNKIMKIKMLHYNLKHLFGKKSLTN